MLTTEEVRCLTAVRETVCRLFNALSKEERARQLLVMNRTLRLLDAMTAGASAAVNG